MPATAVPLTDEAAPRRAPFTAPGFLRNSFIFPLVQMFMGGTPATQIELDTLSSVTSIPLSPSQSWHRDTPYLYKEIQTNESLDLAPHAMVMFVPLTDLQDPATGPPQFMLRSHKPCANMEPRDLGKGNTHVCADTVLWTCNATKGSALLFDIRLLHRGGRNKSRKRRAILYTSYVKHWWVDAVNFQFTQTAALDEVNADVQSLLRRIDSNQYTLNLEAKLAEFGVDVRGMQGTYTNPGRHTGTKVAAAPAAMSLRSFVYAYAPVGWLASVGLFALLLLRPAPRAATRPKAA
jgi:hypothetical protein